MEMESDVLGIFTLQFNSSSKNTCAQASSAMEMNQQMNY